MNGQYHYLTGTCGGEEINEEIANKFIQLLMTTSYGQACAHDPDCTFNAADVRVYCGEQTRRKRDTTGSSQTATIPLTVNFTLEVPILSHRNTSLDLNETSLQISNDILSALDKADMSLNISGVVIQTDPARPPEIRLIRLVCGEGQVQSGATCGNDDIIS